MAHYEPNFKKPRRYIVNGLISWFAKNPVAANLLALTIIVAGGVSTMSMKQEIFPEVDPRMVTVEVVYQGAAPEEVERGICKPIEEAIEGMEGLKKITSTAAEGLGIVNAELEMNVDKGKFLDDFKNKIDGIRTFPEEIEEPVIEEIKVVKQVINVVVAGDLSERDLKDYAEKIREDLLALPEISLAKLVSVRPDEITVQLSEWKLREYNLSMNEVARVIREFSRDIPGGSIRSDGGDVLIRTKSQKYSGDEFAAIIVRTLPDGTVIRVRDIAQVIDGFQDTDLSSRFDGKPAAMIQIFRTGNQSAISISDSVINYVNNAQLSLPEGLELAYWQDDTSYLRSRLSLLLSNGFFGLILVVGTLALFLRLSLAFWVAVGIVVSFFGALWMMPILGVSINLLSLFGFILVLGIVVDDAIVVSENIHEYQDANDALKTKKESLLAIAIRATQEVGRPVAFAVCTTIAAFLPLATAPGSIGEILSVIPLVVIPTLVFSLMESLFILPSHLGHRPAWYDSVKKRLGLFYRFQNWFNNGVQYFIHQIYARALAVALNFRYATWCACIGILIASIGIVAGGWMRFQVFPPVEGDNLAAIVNMPQGTSADVTASIVQRIETAAVQLQSELDAEYDLGDRSIFRHMMTTVGQQPYAKTQSQGAGDYVLTLTSGHQGEVHIELLPSEDRPGTSSEKMALRWEEMVGDLPGVKDVTFTASLFSSGSAIELQVEGGNYDLLMKAVKELKNKLAQYDGVYSIADSFEQAKKEVQIYLKPLGYNLGLTPAMVGQQVRQSFFGAEAQRVQRENEEIRIMVRYPGDERDSVYNLETMMIRLPDGSEVPFTEIADAQLGSGLSTITRVDGRRIINVTAAVDSSKITANEVVSSLNSSGYFDELKATYPGITLGFEGEARDQEELMMGIVQGFPLAIMIIFALLAIPFKSYLQPFIVMSAIPFGLVGAILGHMIMDMDLTIMSVFGIVALSGVVVNDNLVLVDYINRHRDMGQNILDAARIAGIARFRPILLTSLTTFVGLTPLILEKSVQAKFLIPMAVSLAFGVMFATMVSLFLVPSLYLILNDLTGLFKKGNQTPNG